jgi:hypothetical protein
MPTTKSGLLFKDDELLSSLLGIPAAPKVTRSDKETCSFCGCSIELGRATHGMAKPRKIDGGLTKTYNKAGEVIDFESRVLHVADLKVACPECVLMLKPLYKRCPTCKGKNAVEISKCPGCKGTKEGELMHMGIVFPQTEG